MRRSAWASPPTSSPLAKSIGGGLPLAAFGGKREVMEVVVDGRMAHLGTYNGNPLVMAAAKAVAEVCTPEAIDGAERSTCARSTPSTPSSTSTSCRPTPCIGQGLRHLVDVAGAQLPRLQGHRLRPRPSWLRGVNRGVLAPPGLDEQWLISLTHTDEDMATLVDDFPHPRRGDCAADRRGCDG